MPDSTEGFDLNKPDPYDLYEKSRAIYESRREYSEHLLLEVTIKMSQYHLSVYQVQSMKRWRCTCYERRLALVSASWGETRPCRL